MNSTDHQFVLQSLTERGIEITPTGDGNLRIEPAELLTDELRALVKANKLELIKALSANGYNCERVAKALMWKMTLRSGTEEFRTFSSAVSLGEALAMTPNAVDGAINQGCLSCKRFCHPKLQGKPFCDADLVTPDLGASCESYEGNSD